MNLNFRKWFSKSAAVLALTVAGTNGPGLSAAHAQKPGDALNIGLSGLSSQATDPILFGYAIKFYLALVFDYLIGTDAAGNLSKETGLARDWKISTDQKTFTITLRDNAKFQNGEPVTSADVKFSIVRSLGPRSRTGYADYLRDNLDQVEAPSPHQVVITTKNAAPFLLSALSRAMSSEGMIVPKKYIEAKGDDYFNLNPIGSGPYRIAENVPGTQVTLEAVDRHWRAGVPRYKTVTLRQLPEEATRIAMLRQGKLDIIDVSAERLTVLREQGYQVHLKKDDALLNCWWVEPFASTPLGKREVREALSIAIDRQELADTIFSGTAKPAHIPTGWSWAFPEIGLKVTPDMHYKFDPARAKKMLADAGYPKGFAAKIYTAPLPGYAVAQSVAEAIAGYWNNVGVEVKVIPLDYAAFRKIWLDRSDPGAMVCYNQPNRNAYGVFAALDKLGYFAKPTAFMHDPEIERLLNAAKKEPDAGKRNNLLRDIHLQMRKETVTIPVLELSTPYVAAKTLPAWDTGYIPFDMNLDQIIQQPKGK